MEVTNRPCAEHSERIKTLTRRLDAMDGVEAVLHSLDKSYALQSQVMQHMSMRNDQQDDRMDKQDVRLEAQQAVILQVNKNLTELAEAQRLANQEGRDLAEKIKSLDLQLNNIRMEQNANEKRQTIHTGELFRDLVLKIALPVGVIASAIAWLIKLLQ